MDSVKTICVLYNTKITEAAALRFFLNQPERLKDLVIWDNSTHDGIVCENRIIAHKEDLTYDGTGENLGLSRAYNRVIQGLSEPCFIIILDQDTQLPDDFLEQIHAEISLNPSVRVFVPRIKTKQGSWISPCYLKGHRVKAMHAAAPVITDKITAINTGMVLHTSVFLEFGGYNEQLFLDYVDHDWMKKLARSKVPVKIMELMLVQDFSDDNRSDVASALRRFQIYQKDFFQFCKDSFGARQYYRIKIWYRARKLNKAFKTKAFSARNKEVSDT